jgi:Family of unknown function (DUF5681)
MADDYEVGYGKPPKETRFEKGQSGNPKGRPKGSQNIATTFHQITRELIQVSENGKSRAVTKLDAIMLQLVNKAVSGDLKAGKEILQWNQIFENLADRESMENPDTAKNEVVMKAFIRRIRARQSSAQPDVDTTEGPNDNNNG